MVDLWHVYLYVPLLNLYMFITATLAGGNLGFAVVILTLGVRFLLLPFSFIVERNKAVYTAFSGRIAALKKDLANDPAALKEETKRLLLKAHISPWANVVVLGGQALVFVLLYQVFVGGMRSGAAFHELYPWVPQPFLIDPNFFGLDIREQNVLVAVVIGALLFWGIWADQRTRRHTLTRQDLLFQIFFPAITVIILSFLPAAKSLFILTSMTFSFVLDAARQVFVWVSGGSKKEGKGGASEEAPLAFEGNPWDTLRKKA